MAVTDKLVNYRNRIASAAQRALGALFPLMATADKGVTFSDGSTVYLRLMLGVAGEIAATHPRELLSENNSGVLTSGTLRMQAVYLEAGQVITAISIWSASTAAVSPTNCLFGLYSGARTLLATTANFTTTPWPSNTRRVGTLTTEYTVPTSGLYYVGVMVTATTVPTLIGHTGRTTNVVSNTAPLLQGASSTGLTTALPATAAAITTSVNSFYASLA